jgi:hypothetical protein
MATFCVAESVMAMAGTPVVFPKNPKMPVVLLLNTCSVIEALLLASAPTKLIVDGVAADAPLLGVITISLSVSAIC